MMSALEGIGSWKSGHSKAGWVTLLKVLQYKSVQKASKGENFLYVIYVWPLMKFEGSLAERNAGVKKQCPN